LRDGRVRIKHGRRLESRQDRTFVFPSDFPAGISIATDPNGRAISNLGALVRNYPAAAFGEAYAKSRLQALGINCDGATLYLTSSLTVAIDGATVLLGTTQHALMNALDRQSRGAGITKAEMKSATSGLPPNTFIQAFGNLSGVLSNPSAAKARHVPWVAALRGYARQATLRHKTGVDLSSLLGQLTGDLSVAFKIAIPALIQLAVKNAPAQLQSLVASLGDITVWIAATPSGLTGEASLALK